MDKRLYRYLLYNKRYNDYYKQTTEDGWFSSIDLPDSLNGFNPKNIICVRGEIIYSEKDKVYWYICCIKPNNSVSVIELILLNKVIYEYYKSYINNLIKNI